MGPARFTQNSTKMYSLQQLYTLYTLYILYNLWDTWQRTNHVDSCQFPNLPVSWIIVARATEILLQGCSKILHSILFRIWFIFSFFQAGIRGIWSLESGLFWMNLFWTTKLVSDIISSIYNLLQYVMILKFWKFSGKFRVVFHVFFETRIPTAWQDFNDFAGFSECQVRTWLSLHFLDSPGVRDLEPRWTPVYNYYTSNYLWF